MSDAVLDDSILNSEDAAHNSSDAGGGGSSEKIELDEDRIAELLGDNDSTKTDKENNEKVVTEDVEMEDLILDQPDASSPENVVEDIPLERIDEDILLADDVLDEGFDEVGLAVEKEDNSKDVSADSTTGNMEEEVVVNNEIIDEVDLLESDGEKVDDDDLIQYEEGVKEEKDGENEAEEEEEEEEVMEEEGEGNISRKRVYDANSPRSPYHKRSRQNRSAYFEARSAAIEVITKTLGSWDAQLSTNHLRLINGIKKFGFTNMIEVHAQAENALRVQVFQLKEELAKERRAHANTTLALRLINNEVEKIKKEVGKLAAMTTQPPTAKVAEAYENAHLQMVHANRHHHHQQQQQHRPQHHLQKHLQQHHNHQFPPSLQRYPSNMSTGSQPGPSIRYHHNPNPQVQPPPPPHRRSSGGAQAAEYIGAPNGNVPMPISQQQQQPIQMSRVGMRHQHVAPVQPKWTPIPPARTQMGHNEPIVTGEGRPQPLIDQTKPTDNTLKLCVPYCSPQSVISSGDSSRLPSVPNCFAAIHPSPDLTVSITSSAEDFRDTWQIGGKINYEYMAMLDNTTIQVYIQVSSLKFAGMNGCPNALNPLDVVNWGISKPWPCKIKSHKYRILFHHQQQLPANDRITVMAVATNSISGAVQVSQPVFITLR